MLQIPVNVSDIADVRYYPVKVGISDAFVKSLRTGRTNMKYRVFHIYSEVHITKDCVLNGSAVEFRPQTSLFFSRLLKTQWINKLYSTTCTSKIYISVMICCIKIFLMKVQGIRLWQECIVQWSTCSLLLDNRAIYTRKILDASYIKP